MTQRIYTDGSCLGNPGPGGWAWAIEVLVENPNIKVTPRNSYGSEPHTTNQRMELRAVLEALQDTTGPVTIITDSAYIVNCFEQKWYQGWAKNGTKYRNGERVANWDLWKQILDMVLSEGATIEFEKVKGHSGDWMNNYVDELANQAAKKQSTS